MQYTLDQLRQFIAMQAALKDGTVDSGLALSWAMLGWVRQTSITPPLWEVTAVGLKQLANPPC
jgi:hypothetical protein